MVIFYGFDPFFFYQWAPLTPRWTLGVPTVIWRNNRNFDFLRKIDSQKFEFMGMVIFYGFDQIFGPNGTPLAPRWTLGGPHRDLAP